MTDTLTAPNGVAHGYLPRARARWMWVTNEQTVSDDPEHVPFQAEIRTNLTPDDLDALLFDGKTMQALWETMAPYVRDWNLLREDMTTGEVVKVAPPAEGGPQSFRLLDEELSYWLALELRKAHLGGEERGKGSTSPAITADKPNGSDEVSSKRARNGSRTGSTSPSGST